MKFIPEAEDFVVRIPATVSKIKKTAFKNCETVRQVIIPGSVKVISRNTFINCTTLTQVILEEGVEEIEKEAFYCCKSLSSIHLPSSIHKISPNAFWGCIHLETIDIPESVEKDNAWYIRNCSVPSRFAIMVEVLAKRSRSFPQTMHYPALLVRAYLRGHTELEDFLQQYFDASVPMYKRIALGDNKEDFFRNYAPEIDFFHEVSAISADAWKK